MKKIAFLLSAIFFISAHAMTGSSKKEDGVAAPKQGSLIGRSKFIPQNYQGEFGLRNKKCSDKGVINLSISKSSIEIKDPAKASEQIKCELKGTVATLGNTASFNAVCVSSAKTEDKRFAMRISELGIDLVNVYDNQTVLFSICTANP